MSALLVGSQDIFESFLFEQNNRFCRSKTLFIYISSDDKRDDFCEKPPLIQLSRTSNDMI